MDVSLANRTTAGRAVFLGMLSIIIATLDSERALVRTLAALVPGAAEGLVSEVLLADGGSGDDTEKVADVAGCKFMQVNGPLGRRLTTAASAARAPWLLFLRPGTIPDTPWISEIRSFVAQPPSTDCTAVFRRAAPVQSGLRAAIMLAAATLGGNIRPEQGLLIGNDFYRQIGGHSEHAAEPERDLIRRIGQRRIVTLSTGVFAP